MAEFSRKPRLTAFAATLGYSRASYVEFVNNQRLETLLACHEHAFAFFAGVSKTVLHDNMRTVVVQRDAYGQGLHRFQQGLWDFAKHYGFIPKLCRPYRACTKGKIERFIHYLRYSFYQPLMTKLQAQGVALDVRMANDYVLTWLHQVANHRVHGTTGKIPWQQLEQERLFLQPLPSAYQGQVQPLVSLKPMPAGLPNNLLIVNQQQPISLQHPLTVYDALVKPGAVL